MCVCYVVILKIVGTLLLAHSHTPLLLLRNTHSHTLPPSFTSPLPPPSLTPTLTPSHTLSLLLPYPFSQSHSHTQVIKDDCQTDLDAAMPAYESALKALATLDKKSVQEMKGFTNPPEMVKFTLEAVCILLEVKPGKMMIRLF